ncbi:BUD13 homolog [Bombina bombina]|uniref:BUD13 homolog n=1 Tax=Bombina bombina TaxID=8345 RepID=UPI00235AFF82|nr:BUD13 homolog [Bombina bombina]
MAAAGNMSKAEYLRRYLEPDSDQETVRRKRKKKRPEGRGMRIVDDDVEDWKKESEKPDATLEEEEDQPVVAEFVDERPEEVKRMEEFKNTNKWRVIQDTGDTSPRGHLPQAPEARVGANSLTSLQSEKQNSSDSSLPREGRHDSPDPSPTREGRHDSPDPSPPRAGRHDSPDSSPPRRGRQDSPDPSPRRGRQDSSDLSPHKGRRDSSDPSPPRRGRHDSPDPSPPRKQKDNSDLSPRRGKPNSLQTSSPYRVKEREPKTFKSSHVNGKSLQAQRPRSHSPTYKDKRRNSDSDFSPPRKKKSNSLVQNKGKEGQMSGTSSPRHGQSRGSDSDLSPPRCAQRRGSDSDLSPPRCAQRRGSDSDLSPPRRDQRRGSDSDLSPPRGKNGRMRHPEDVSSGRTGRSSMLSGGRAGLVSAEVLREEKKEQKILQRDNKHLEDDSKNAQTVFRDKSGKRRDLKLEREEQRQKQAAQEQKDEQYAQWGRGLAQKEQQRQNLEHAAKEIQKPLARYIDDADLDKMLREQEREGDPMAKFLQKKKASETKKERPRYKGTNPPPNRFNIWPGYRWDGVDRSNGFEKQMFARQSDKKAMQEAAYKWSVEDM